MQFNINIKKPIFNYDQEINLELSIINGNNDIEMPRSFYSSRLSLLKILDENNNPILDIFGHYDQQRQTPLGGSVTSGRTHGHFTLKANKTISWKMELLEFTDPLPPGKYQLQAEIFNTDKSPLISSNKIAFEVTGNYSSKGFDIIRHEGDLNLIKLLTAHAYQNHIQVHIADNYTPNTYMRSYSVAYNANNTTSKPLFAEANCNRNDVPNALSQLVWKNNSTLYLYSYYDSSSLIHLSGTKSTSIEQHAQLVGRPFFNEKKCLSVFLLQEQHNRYQLSIETFDDQLNFLSSKTIIELNTKPCHIETSANYNGSIEILVLENQKFPLLHFRSDGDGFVNKIINIPKCGPIKPEDTILFTNINAKYHQHPYKSITAVLLDNESKTKLTTVSIDTADDNQDIKIIRQYQLPKIITDEFEQLFFAQSIVTNLGDTDSVDELEYDNVTVIGFKDQIYKLNTDGSIVEIPTSANAKISEATLFQDKIDSIYIVIPEKNGGYKTELLINI